MQLRNPQTGDSGPFNFDGVGGLKEQTDGSPSLPAADSTRTIHGAVTMVGMECRRSGKIEGADDEPVPMTNGHVCDVVSTHNPR